MLLDKSPTQEEFIRGQLTNNPYNSAEVGPLMRDVKNFICRELDMEGDHSETSAWHAALGHNMRLQQSFLYCALLWHDTCCPFVDILHIAAHLLQNMATCKSHNLTLAAHWLRYSWLALWTAFRKTTVCLSHNSYPSTVSLALL